MIIIIIRTRAFIISIEEKFSTECSLYLENILVDFLEVYKGIKKDIK